MTTFVEGSRSAYDHVRYAAHRDAIHSKLGGVCANCGSDVALEVDHIDPSTKTFSVMERWGRPIEDLIEELEKCQLLCKSCHLSKTVQASSVEHGGGKSGKRNCPCDLCKARKREYMREYKRTKG